MQAQRKLYRSTTDRKLAGVFGGIEEFAGVDATILRVLFVVLVIFTGFFPGILAYILAALIIPVTPEGYTQAAHRDTTGDGTGEDIDY